MLRDLIEAGSYKSISANDDTYIYKAMKGFPVMINGNIGFLILSRSIQADKLYKEFSSIMEEDFDYTVYKVRTSNKNEDGSLFVEVDEPVIKEKKIKTVGIFIFFGPKYLFTKYEMCGYILPFIPINESTSSIIVKKYMEEGLFFRETTLVLEDFKYSLSDLYYYADEVGNSIYLKESISLYFAIYYEKLIKVFFEKGDCSRLRGDIPFIYVNSFTGENNEDKDSLRYEFIRSLELEDKYESPNVIHVFESRKMDYSLSGNVFDECFEFPCEKEKIKREEVEKNLEVFSHKSTKDAEVSLFNFLKSGPGLDHFIGKVNKDIVNIMEFLAPEYDEDINFKLFVKGELSVEEEWGKAGINKYLADKMRVLYVPNYISQGFIITLDDLKSISENMIFMFYRVYTLMVNLFDVNVNLLEIKEENASLSSKDKKRVKNLYVDKFLTAYVLYEGEKPNKEDKEYKHSTLSFKTFRQNLFDSIKIGQFFGIYISLDMETFSVPFKLNSGETIFSVCYYDDALTLAFKNREFVSDSRGGGFDSRFKFRNTNDDITIYRFIAFFPLFLQMLKLQGEKFAYYAKVYQKENPDDIPNNLKEFDILYNNIMDYSWNKTLEALFYYKTYVYGEHDINIMNFNEELFTMTGDKSENYLVSSNAIRIGYPKITLCIIDNSYLGFFISCYDRSSIYDVYTSLHFIELLKDQGYSVFPMKYQYIWKKNNLFYVGDEREKDYHNDHIKFDYVFKYFVLLPDVICDYFNDKPFNDDPFNTKVSMEKMIDTTYIIGFGQKENAVSGIRIMSKKDLEEMEKTKEIQMYETKIDGRWFLYHKDQIISVIAKRFSEIMK